MLEFEPGLLIWTCVSFGLLVLLLYRVGVPALIAFLNEREKFISDTLAQAADTKKQAEAVLAENRKQLEHVQEQADTILSQAKQEGDKIKNETVAQAEKKAQLIVEQAQQQLTQERDRLAQGVRQQMADLLALAAGKLMRGRFNAEEHHELVKQSLAEAEKKK